MSKLVFTTIGAAKKITGLSYLGAVNKSAKLEKNGKVSGQMTYGLYLAPASVSGYNVCSHSTNECRLGCLATSGRAGMEINSKGKCNRINNARTVKTKLFFEENDFFMAWLVAELQAAKIKAEKNNMGFSVRLNCTSDIDWQNTLYMGTNVFDYFSDVQFYDYTKNPNKFIGIASNYHLTFSYTGRNWHACKAVLKRGHNIAIVFNVKNENQIPAMYNGFKVVNGDLTDYRVNDGNGVIVGLKWKRIANRVAEKEVLNSCFVVKPENIVVNVQGLAMAMAV